VLDAIGRLAVRFHPPEGSITAPLIHSLLPWPTQPAMNAELRRDLEQRRVLKVEMLGIPKCDWQSPEDPIATAIALSHLRRELARRTDARVCVGGQTGRGSDATPLSGFFAGVIEEAYDSAVAAKPVYVAGFLGGASASLASVLRDPAQRALLGEVFQVLPSGADLFERVSAQSAATGLVPPRDLSAGFDPERLQVRSGLNPGEWQDLLSAPDIEAFATLVIRGLRRLERPQR